MIELPRSQKSKSATELSIKILGLGGAGANALDRVMLDGFPGAGLVAVNTDAQSLIASVATEKVQIGRATTRGLGTGGDPELGYQAAEEGADEIRAAIAGAPIVFILAGLGGGTGSGAAPLIANYAREHNALVIVIATLPFHFEGRRRLAQAEEALSALQQQADIVICFENDRMGDAVSPTAGIHEAFSVADQTISQSVRAIASLVSERGMIHIGFDELAHTLRGQNARCIFGFGEAGGGNRAHEALARALKCPLMDRGRLLEDTATVLVNVTGGEDMTLNEIQIMMEELGRHISDETRILFGCRVDPALAGKMRVTIVSSIGAGAPARLAPVPTLRALPQAVQTVVPVVRAPQPEPRLQPPVAVEIAPPAELLREPVVEVPAAAVSRAPEPEPIEPEPAEPERAVEPEIEPAPVRLHDEEEQAAAATATAVHASKKAEAAAAKAEREAKQAQMQFEPASRGRFEKSERTIVDGEDLDVPTYLRRSMKVK